MSEDRFLELVNSFIDQEISEDEREELRAELRRDPVRLAEFREMWAVAAASRSVMTTTCRSFGWRFWLRSRTLTATLAAACVLLMFGGLMITGIFSASSNWSSLDEPVQRTVLVINGNLFPAEALVHPDVLVLDSSKPLAPQLRLAGLPANAKIQVFTLNSEAELTDFSLSPTLEDAYNRFVAREAQRQLALTELGEKGSIATSQQRTPNLDPESFTLQPRRQDAQLTGSSSFRSPPEADEEIREPRANLLLLNL